MKRSILLLIALIPCFLCGQLHDPRVKLCHDKTEYLKSFNDSICTLLFDKSAPILYFSGNLIYRFNTQELLIKSGYRDSVDIVLSSVNNKLTLGYLDTTDILDSAKMFYSKWEHPIKDYSGILTANTKIGNTNFTIVWDGYFLRSVIINNKTLKLSINYEWNTDLKKYSIHNIVDTSQSTRYDIGFQNYQFRYFRSFDNIRNIGVFMWSKRSCRGNRVRTIKDELFSFEDEKYYVNKSTVYEYKKNGKILKNKSAPFKICE